MIAGSVGVGFAWVYIIYIHDEKVGMIILKQNKSIYILTCPSRPEQTFPCLRIMISCPSHLLPSPLLDQYHIP